ncbi:MAG: S49 family peptidase [Proteobacteria bacterium]|nr:S49 family peptidase [Pseudomonadota bacterium]
MTEQNSTPNATWEAKLIQQLATDYLKEKKRKRRWSIFFKLAFIILFVWLVFAFYKNDQEGNEKTNKPHVALIDIFGPIEDEADTADNAARSLREAFKDKLTVGIILRINSPGGSPVQADYVFNEITRLRKLYPKTKVYAVCTDLCASAAYYIAAAADEIYANPASLVGSIGVLYNGFGFVDILQKVGVERRLITAGKNKGFMDPFSPLEPEQKQIMQSMLDSVHTQFEDRVMQGRGTRLKVTPEIFSGLFWTGTRAKELGLIDGFGSAGSVARDVIKNSNIIDYTVKPNVLERFANRLGTSMSSELAAQLGLNAKVTGKI